MLETLWRVCYNAAACLEHRSWYKMKLKQLDSPLFFYAQLIATNLTTLVSLAIFVSRLRFHFCLVKRTDSVCV